MRADEKSLDVQVGDVLVESAGRARSATLKLWRVSLLKVDFVAARARLRRLDRDGTPLDYHVTMRLDELRPPRWTKKVG